MPSYFLIMTKMRAELEVYQKNNWSQKSIKIYVDYFSYFDVKLKEKMLSCSVK